MSKGDHGLHDRTKIPAHEMAYNWMGAFGEKWCVIAPKGNRLGRKFKSYEAAREWALNEYSGDVEFGLVKV